MILGLKQQKQQYVSCCARHSHIYLFFFLFIFLYMSDLTFEIVLEGRCYFAVS